MLKRPADARCRDFVKAPPRNILPRPADHDLLHQGTYADFAARWTALEVTVPPLSAVPPKDVAALVATLNRVRQQVERARLELEYAEQWMGRRWWTRVAAVRRQGGVR